MEHLATLRHSNVRKRVIMTEGEAAVQDGRTRRAAPTGILAGADG